MHVYMYIYLYIHTYIYIYTHVRDFVCIYFYARIIPIYENKSTLNNDSRFIHILSACAIYDPKKFHLTNLIYIYYFHYRENKAEEYKGNAIDSRACQDPLQLHNVFCWKNYILSISIVRNIGCRIGSGFFCKFAT